MTGEIRTLEVALSTEALLHQWARSESAPEGAAIVAHQEIAARLRGGTEWRTPDAVAVSVLARPSKLDPTDLDLGWLAAGIGAATALASCFGGDHRCLWPDRVDGPLGADVEAITGSTAHLEPGRVEYLILSARVGPLASADRERVIDALVIGLRAAVDSLNDPDSLVAAYRVRCATLGRTVTVSLLPHGTTRGTADDIGHAGSLQLSSATGLKEHLPVSMVNRVEPVNR